MTPRAYSLFIMSVCATKAALEPFSFRPFITLLYECVYVGSPNIRTVGHLIALFVLPQKIRYIVRDVLAMFIFRPLITIKSFI